MPSSPHDFEQREPHVYWAMKKTGVVRKEKVCGRDKG